MTIGPARLAVDTSKDGFLRRAGMTDAVRHAYLERARAPLDALRAMARAPAGGPRADADERLRAPRARRVGRARGDRRPDRAAHRLVPGRPADHVRVLDPGARRRRRGRRLALAGTPGVARHARRSGRSSASWPPARSSSWSRQAAVHRPARGRSRDHRRADRGHAAPRHTARVRRGRRRRDGVVPGHPCRQRDPRRRCRRSGWPTCSSTSERRRTSCAASPRCAGAWSTTRCLASTSTTSPRIRVRGRRSCWCRSTGRPMRRPTRVSRAGRRGCRSTVPGPSRARRGATSRSNRRRRPRSCSRRSSSWRSPVAWGSAGRGGPGSTPPASAAAAPAIGIATLALVGRRAGTARATALGKRRPDGRRAARRRGGYALLVLQGAAPAPAPPPVEEQPAE